MKQPTRPLKKMRVLVTAGPTREYLDPVRYLSSDSSGRMGFAFARAARKLGARVTLISGPVTLATPKGVKRIDVVSAEEMCRITLRESKRSDVMVMTAAVSDWRPTQQHLQKMKRQSPQKSVKLILRENSDILAELGRRKKTSQILVGFALETKNLQERALRKLREKKCDWVVANDISAIGATIAQVLFLHKDGKILHLPRLSKNAIAHRVLTTILNQVPTGK